MAKAGVEGAGEESGAWGPGAVGFRGGGEGNADGRYWWPALLIL